MLAAERDAAVEAATTWAGWWLFRRPVPPRPEAVARQLADDTGAWAGPGTARVTDRHAVFAADRFERRTSLRTIADVVQSGRTLWVRRRRAHDWLVRFETEADADRVGRALRGAGR